MNKLFEALGNNSMSQIMTEVNKFAQTIKGDPKQMVMQLLNSGQMSQADFNKYAQMAQQIAPLMRG